MKITMSFSTGYCYSKTYIHSCAQTLRSYNNCTMPSTRPVCFNSPIDPCFASSLLWPCYVVYVVASRPSTLLPPPCSMWGASQGMGDMATGPQGQRATGPQLHVIAFRLTLVPLYGVMRGRRRIRQETHQKDDIPGDL